MKIHMSKSLFLPAAVLGGVAVFAAVFFVALAVHSVVADPGGTVPDPGHAWTDIQGHGDDADACYVSTESDQAFEVRVNNERALRLEPHATSPNVIGGYSGNSVSGGAYGATIGGGGVSGGINQVTGHYGTVAGGYVNEANAHAATVGGGQGNIADVSYATVPGGRVNEVTDDYGTVGGGQSNMAGDDLGDPDDATHATVAGGYNNGATNAGATVGGGGTNNASGQYATVPGGGSNTASANYATIGGGHSNDASASYATIGGGHDNTASGTYASVPGGETNSAAGDFSFAAGRQAKVDANHDGAFVWADSTEADFASERADQFRVRANGGARFDVNTGGWVNIYEQTKNLVDILIDTSTGATLTQAGIWTNVSDRAQKENFTPVDGEQVLASLADMPITTWNHKAEDASVRHIGPTAQDFYATFGLGASDTSIGTLDAEGVALAAIQGLYEIVQEQDSRIDDLEARVAALEGGQPLERGSESLLSSITPFGPLFLAGLFVVGGLVLVQRRRAGGRP